MLWEQGCGKQIVFTLTSYDSRMACWKSRHFVATIWNYATSHSFPKEQVPTIRWFLDEI